MNIQDLLIGKSVMVMTDMKVEVQLKISKIENTSWTQQITPDTKENDWWGETKTHRRYTVTFENGAKKNYESLESINIIS